MSEPNNERFARLLGRNLKIALQCHFSLEQVKSGSRKIEEIFSSARKAGLTYEKNGKFQVFVPSVIQADTSLESVVARKGAVALFPGDILPSSWKTFLVFRRQTSTSFNGRTSSIKTIPMMAARHGEDGCFRAFSSVDVVGNPNFVSLIVGSNDPTIQVGEFNPVFFKVKTEDRFKHAYFEVGIDMIPRIGTTFELYDVRVIARVVEEERAPVWLQVAVL